MKNNAYRIVHTSTGMKGILKTGVMLLVLISVAAGCRRLSGWHQARERADTEGGADQRVLTQNSGNESNAWVGHQSVLRPGLSIRVAVIVSGRREIEESAKRISEDGEITLPLLGIVPVAGLSVSEASEKIRVLSEAYFVNPQVLVEFVQDSGADAMSPWGHVTVLGRVGKPGRVNIPATRDLTLSGVIQRAGGYASSARDNAIRVTRRTPEGPPVTFEINLRAVGARGQIENDILMQPDDVVYVPEALF